MNLENIIVCPICKKKLELSNNLFNCQNCTQEYHYNDNIPNLLYYEEQDLVSADKQPFLEHKPYYFQRRKGRQKRFNRNVVTKIVREFWCQEINSFYKENRSSPLILVDIGLGLWDTDSFKNEVRETVQASVSSYFGIDPSLTQLVRLRNQGSVDVIPLRAFGERCPIEGGFFDICFVLSTLDHVFNPSMVLSEAYRILRPGGKLVVGLGNPDAWWRRLFPNLKQARNPEHLFAFSPLELRSVVEATGFIDVRIADLCYFRGPYVIQEIISAWINGAVKLLKLIDVFGRRYFKYMGGKFITVATKPYLC